MNFKHVLCCVLTVLAATLISIDAVANKPCKTAKGCKQNPNCLCYCSEKGDFREKIVTGKNKDKPVWVENDPNEIFCYCKQWDLDEYPGPAKRPQQMKK